MKKQTCQGRYRDRTSNVSDGMTTLAFSVFPQLLYEKKRKGEGVDGI